MQSDKLEEWVEYAQKKYHLTKTESTDLRLLLLNYPDSPREWTLEIKSTPQQGLSLSNYPEVFREWVEIIGLTPPQIAHKIAEEFCNKFPEPIPVPFSDGANRLHTFTVNSFLAAIGPHRSWKQLEDALRKASRTFATGKIYDFFERKSFVIYAALTRNDSYGLRGDRRDPEKTEQKRASKKRETKMAINGAQHTLKFPRHDFMQCRLCWRHVPVDPQRVSRKAPLCPQQ